ncbi:MAG: DUF6655 family protein [Pirellulales bacterium]
MDCYSSCRAGQAFAALTLSASPLVGAVDQRSGSELSGEWRGRNGIFLSSPSSWVVMQRLLRIDRQELEGGREADCRRSGMFCAVMGWALLLVLTGCGTMRDNTATQQLLLSDAVDRAVAHIDFAPLDGERVYLDTKYLNDDKPQPGQKSGGSLVNSNYIISSLRQQMMAAGCMLQEKPDDADYVVEARVGTLGADGHDVNYGVQGSGALSAAAIALSSVPAMPTLPEISLARKTEDAAVAKLSLFAYHRTSRTPVWQSGMSLASSKSQRRWVLGAGPFQSGQVYAGTEGSGDHLVSNPFSRDRNQMADREDRYRKARIFESRLREKMLSKLDLSSDSERVAQRKDETPPAQDSKPAEPAAPAPSSP